MDVWQWKGAVLGGVAQLVAGAAAAAAERRCATSGAVLGAGSPPLTSTPPLTLRRLPSSYKSHPLPSRDGNDVYAVNSMAFHPQFGTFVTAGSDGAYNFWDKDSKQRLKAMQKCSMPITCGDFNRCGFGCHGWHFTGAWLGGKQAAEWGRLEQA